jgi:coenzyme F420 hydrogenase subunit beta
MNNNKINPVVTNNLCIGCGLCAYAGYTLDYNKKRGQYEPNLKSKNYDKNLAWQICPGKGYDIVKEGSKLFPNQKYSLELGFYNSIQAVHSNSEEILKNASSGGIMTELALYLLEEGLVDAIVSTNFYYTKDGPRTQTKLINTKIDLLSSQGSKYIPVNMDKLILELKEFNGTVAFIGTPCQIAGIRNIQQHDETLKKKIRYTIANFCGGFKDYRNVDKIIKKYNFVKSKINYFRFRGGGQPGSMAIKDVYRKELKLPYPDYMSETGYPKHKRCKLCTDATGELADFSCGDLWLSNYLKDEFPWSVIICRNTTSDEIVKDLISKGKISTKTLTESEVIKSQKTNITSKKYRLFSKLRMYKLFYVKVPDIPTGLSKDNSSVIHEIKVLILQKQKFIREKIGLHNTKMKFWEKD